MASTADADYVLRRDSRVVECQVPIPEEDESTETASEPAEPITPTSDTAPASHPFRHDGPDESHFMTPKYSMLDDTPATPATAAAPPTPVTRTKSNNKLTVQPEQATPAPEKPGLGKRVGSFMRNKLHRQPSANNVHNASNPPTERVYVKTGVDGPKEVSSPAINIPRTTRRFSTFSLSARSTPKSSHGHSPPSSASPTSTISEDKDFSMDPRRPRHKHSSSSTAISSMNKGPGIKWASKESTKRPTPFSRRRSASTEIVPKLRDDNKTVGLIDTFSKPAAEGVGLKSRRLSLSLPDEFVVDTCELNKEFKDTSAIPGRRGVKCGNGATAEVRVMARKGGNKEDLVAVKVFRAKEKDENEDDYVKKIKSEFSIAKSLHHPNIVDTLRLCTHKGRWIHVMEYCNLGELYSLVERRLFAGNGEGYYSADDRLCFFKQLIRGVDYLHSHGVAHRDIKLENLLLDKEGHLKITDFGVAEVFSGEHPGLRGAAGECGKNMGEIRLSNPGICGSLPYIAPEVLEKKNSYDPRGLDVWSCAVVYLTMTFGGSPWEAAKPDFKYYARFKRGWDEWIPNHPEGEITDTEDGFPNCGNLFKVIQPPALKRLLLKMLHPIPEQRITISQVLSSSYLKSINCCCPETYEDQKCCIDATKASSKQTAQLAKTKRFLHHHIPPAPENKALKFVQHRFDMGDGW
ncbi:kinase-like domain-containing protein [Lophiotrema nucula]|uniref:non-specific serine/threonine protein kinase n=1 Tax=Lophiotrema nucula TaxID=690887 RepID=A0A6A5Z6W6_9PLEO|nr:kinase-like domain-containing protein [Lophiotrema nucula]